MGKEPNIQNTDFQQEYGEMFHEIISFFHDRQRRKISKPNAIQHARILDELLRDYDKRFRPNLGG